MMLGRPAPRPIDLPYLSSPQQTDKAVPA
jgi:hypothetical protein